MTPCTLFVNGRFWTLQPGEPDATILLARGGRIEYVGNTLPPAPGADVVDLRGGTAVPGPVDAHCHLVSYGMQHLREADLRGSRSLAEIGELLEAHRRRLGRRPGDGGWLLGRAFDQDLLVGQRWPTRADLDALYPEIPVRITRVCGHALVANTAALRAASLDPTARHHDFPEGVRTEEAMGPIHAAIPAPGESDWRAAARWACAEAARAGFVGVHSLMAHEREVRALLDLQQEEGLPVHVLMHLPYALLETARGVGLRTGFGNDYLAVGGIKLFSDGSLGARTAALDTPYTDDPSTTGELIYPPEELAARAQNAVAAGFQVVIHAIGDRAMQVSLDAIRHAGPHRWPPRIEHASMVNDSLIAQMRELGVGAAIQPQFAHSDAWTPERVGPLRARGCYAFRSLREAGIPLAGSTDCPVELLDARAAIGQLVHRPAWSPDEGLFLDETLRLFSEGSYRLQGVTGGRLREGERADFLVWAEDPRRLPPAELPRAPLRMTVVGGTVRAAAEP